LDKIDFRVVGFEKKQGKEEAEERKKGKACP
jgi:hypothetical protein